ncbi:hypothetical protein AtNW77_Chr3g0195141 [Arabidopsis thaliana]
MSRLFSLLKKNDVIYFNFLLLFSLFLFDLIWAEEHCLSPHQMGFKSIRPL